MVSPDKKTVMIGSINPAKLDAVKCAFNTAWCGEGFHFLGLDVKSGVSKQPKSDRESLVGARNRAIRAIEANNDAIFGVGMEGGVQRIVDKYFECGWVVVLNRWGDMGVGSTVRIAVPPRMVELIHQGLELAEITDQIFETGVESAKTNGFMGHMTNNAITRTTGYRDGVLAALARFLQPEIFTNLPT